MPNLRRSTEVGVGRDDLPVCHAGRVHEVHCGTELCGPPGIEEPSAQVERFTSSSSSIFPPVLGTMGPDILCFISSSSPRLGGAPVCFFHLLLDPHEVSPVSVAFRHDFNFTTPVGKKRSYVCLCVIHTQGPSTGYLFATFRIESLNHNFEFLRCPPTTATQPPRYPAVILRHHFFSNTVLSTQKSRQHEATTY